MADARALTRVIDEFLWALRREGFPVATSQAIDVVRAVREIGLAQSDAVREAIACIVVERAPDRRRFDAAFDSVLRDVTIATRDVLGASRCSRCHGE